MKYLSNIEQLDKENQLVIANMPLVVSIAYKYRPIFPDDHDDLIQIGSIGLLKAIRAFDESMGNKLSTLATLSINREILKRLCKKKSVTESLFDGDYDIIDDSQSEEEFFFTEELYEHISVEEKRILYMRFYLNCNFQEIADEFNKTRQWAHQRIKIIVDKIKEHAKEKDSISDRS